MFSLNIHSRAALSHLLHSLASFSSQHASPRNANLLVAFISQSQKLKFTSKMRVRKSSARFLFFSFSPLPHHFSLSYTICLNLPNNVLCMAGKNKRNSTPHNPKYATSEHL